MVHMIDCSSWIFFFLALVLGFFYKGSSLLFCGKMKAFILKEILNDIFSVILTFLYKTCFPCCYIDNIGLWGELTFLFCFWFIWFAIGALYCLCKDGVGNQALQSAIDYACGAGADCTPILLNGACYQPNTVKDHCNYAVNSYYQRKGNAQGTCDFAGAATTSPNPPGKCTSKCIYIWLHVLDFHFY